MAGIRDIIKKTKVPRTPGEAIRELVKEYKAGRKKEKEMFGKKKGKKK